MTGVLLCPLCSQPRFDNLETLRRRLIHAATQNISCPICNEVLVGLDKLTIHLFGHTLNDQPHLLHDINEQPQLNEDKVTSPHIELDLLFDDREKHALPSSSTVNLEDLSFLTSWENDTKYRHKPEITTETLGMSSADSSQSSGCKENTELSEYMSDLLNKKLPISNFIFEEKEVPPEDDKISCDECGLLFPGIIILNMHKELVHSTINVQNETDNTPQWQQITLPETVVEAVVQADTNSVTQFELTIPIEIKEPSPTSKDERNFHCDLCPKTFKRESHLVQHLKTHDGKQWQCETCSKHFTTKYFLKKHQRLHTGEMPYCCPTCGKTFTFQQSYHKHILYHSDDKPHECPECGRSFKELSTLHNHQRIHSGEKPFSCQICGKCFRQRVSYIVHQRIHTGVLPYQCTACKKKFRYKVSQRSHKCTAHPPGIVVRQTSDLIQRIIDHRNNILTNFNQE